MALSDKYHISHYMVIIVFILRTTLLLLLLYSDEEQKEQRSKRPLPMPLSKWLTGAGIVYWTDAAGEKITSSDRVPHKAQTFLTFLFL